MKFRSILALVLVVFAIVVASSFLTSLSLGGLTRGQEKSAESGERQPAVGGEFEGPRDEMSEATRSAIQAEVNASIAISRLAA